MEPSQSFFAGIPGVNYTVIMSGTEGEDTYAVEYDCGDPLDISWLTNYCIHVLARKPTMSPDLLARLLEKAEAMGIHTLRYKTVGWSIAAFFLGISGALFGNMIGFIEPLEVAFPTVTFGIFIRPRPWASTRRGSA